MRPPPPAGSSSDAHARLYLITDRKATAGRDLARVIAGALAALPAGAALVQVREKDLATRELLALCRQLRAITAEHGCGLLVNDRLDVALAVGADGVHLPERGLPIEAARAVGGPALMIGASTHGAKGAAAAARAGAEIVVCGPIWPTPSKAAFGPPLGEPALARAAAAVREHGSRLYALGGVTTPAEARAARAAGAYGVALIRAVMAAPDPGHAALAMHNALAQPLAFGRGLE